MWSATGGLLRFMICWTCRLNDADIGRYGLYFFAGWPADCWTRASGRVRIPVIMNGQTVPS